MSGKPEISTPWMVVHTDNKHEAFLIDVGDYEVVRRYFWWISDDGYPATSIGKAPQQSTCAIHLFLLGSPPPGFQWDHENRDKTDNRRANLWPLTFVQNQHNVGLRRDNKTGVAGVYKLGDKWTAKIRVDRKQIHLGTFHQFEMACAKRWAAEKYRSVGAI